MTEELLTGERPPRSTGSLMRVRIVRVSDRGYNQAPHASFAELVRTPNCSSAGN